MKNALVIMTLVVVLSFILTAYFIVNKKVEYNLNRSTGYTIVNIDNSSNYNNSNVEKTIKLYKEYHQNIVDDVTGTNIDDVFYENNLIWNKVKYNVTDDIYGEYYQISGLKNKEVENKINIKLENSFKNFIDDNKNYILKKIAEAIKEEEYRYNQGWEERVDNHPYILRQEVLSNFGNVISCANYFDVKTRYLKRYMTSMKSYSNYNLIRDNEFINLNLNNGEELKFEQLFTKDADIIRLVSNAFHNDIRGEFQLFDWEQEKTVDNSMSFSPSNIELLIEKLVKKFKNTEKISFGFTPARLFMSIDGINAEMSLKDNSQYVAIYKRYLDDSIFENGHSNNLISAFLNVTYDNSLLFSDFVKMNGSSFEYYIYDAINSGQLNYKESVTEYVKNYIEKEMQNQNYDSKFYGPRNNCMLLGVISITAEDFSENYKDVVGNDFTLYIIPKIDFQNQRADYQDCDLDEGIFIFNNLYYDEQLCSVFAIKNGKIIKYDELLSFLGINEDDVYLYLNYDMGIVEYYFKNDYKKEIFNKKLRCVQYSNILEFTGVT